MDINPLENHVKQLINILQQENSILERIKLLEMEKNNLLTYKKEVVDLTFLNDSLEKLLKSENVLEQRREAILQELSRYFQISSLTLDILVEKISPELKKELIKVKNSLLKITSEIKEYNEINKIILNDLLKLVGYALDFYSQERILETNYGRKKGQSKEYRSMVINTTI
ncbi:MAG: flagellar protein FlgN [Spirochaetota bacterium]|nr:flagellar protein FlgN [Spirochaetota bacterium]